jgi:hypothetical protein
MNEVLITDSESGGYEFNEAYFGAIDRWATENCNSYRGYHVQDVSDFSLLWDEIAAYQFEDDKDAVLFTLRWK